MQGAGGRECRRMVVAALEGRGWFVAARDGGRGLLGLIETESCELDCHKYLPSPGSVDT